MQPNAAQSKGNPAGHQISQFTWNTHQYQTPLPFMFKKGNCLESRGSRGEIISISSRDQYRPANLTLLLKWLRSSSTVGSPEKTSHKYSTITTVSCTGLYCICMRFRSDGDLVVEVVGGQDQSIALPFRQFRGIHAEWCCPCGIVSTEPS